MTELMKSVVDSGTARRLRWRYKLDNDIAGKTGTTQNQTDGWFMGYTPKLVGGVWVGGPDRTVRFNNIQLGQGANMALPIFGEFLSRLAKNPKYKSMVAAEFPEPNDYVTQLLNCAPWVPYETSGVAVVAEEVVGTPTTTTTTTTTTTSKPTTKPKISINKPTKRPITKPKVTTRPKSKPSKKKKKKKSLKERLFGRKK